MSKITRSNETRKLRDLKPCSDNPRKIDDAQGKRLVRRDEFRIATDRDYYAVIWFQCEDQKVKFLTTMGWLENSFEERFLDGPEVARSLGVDIKPIDLPMKVTKKRTPVKLRKQEVIR